MEFAGDLETHLTVRLSEPESLRRLQKLAETHGLKCLHIILERGAAPSQPMVSWRMTGALSSAIEKARLIGENISAEGFPVIRVKIEAAPWNEDVPQTRAEALDDSEERYFETHIRLQYDIRADNSNLLRIAETHSAHLSKNAFKRGEGTLEERFITQRCRSVGYLEAHQKLGRLLKEIKEAGYAVIDAEEEFVVYDTNLELDAGWIQVGE